MTTLPNPSKLLSALLSQLWPKVSRNAKPRKSTLQPQAKVKQLPSANAAAYARLKLKKRLPQPMKLQQPNNFPNLTTA